MSAFGDRGERRRRPQLDRDPAAVRADARASPGPARQRLARGAALGVAPGGAGERAGLGRAVGDRQRIADEQQLQGEGGRQSERGQRRQQLDRGLALDTP